MRDGNLLKINANLSAETALSRAKRCVMTVTSTAMTVVMKNACGTVTLRAWIAGKGFVMAAIKDGTKNKASATSDAGTA